MAAQLHSKQFMGETLNEMEELSRSGLFTAEQLKIPARKKHYEQVNESNAPKCVYDNYLDLNSTPANSSYAEIVEYDYMLCVLYFKPS